MSNQILISMPIDEFWKKIQELLQQVVKSNQPIVEQKDGTNFLTRNETAKMLRISLPTLAEYTNNGIIPGYRIGAGVRYKQSEVENSVQLIKSIKYQKGLR